MRDAKLSILVVKSPRDHCNSKMKTNLVLFINYIKFNNSLQKLMIMLKRRFQHRFKYLQKSKL